MENTNLKELVIDGQPQRLGNRMITYDGLVDFLEMLKNEIPRMGTQNSIHNGAEFCYIFGSQNEAWGKYQLGIGKSNHLGQADHVYIFGSQNDAEADNVFIFGEKNCGSFNKETNIIATPMGLTYGFVAGFQNQIQSSQHTQVFGSYNTLVNACYSHILGHHNIVNNVTEAYGFGNNLILTNNAVWIGQYNNQNDRLTDVVFGIGSGESDTTRKNALIITKNNVVVLNPDNGNFSNESKDIKNSIFIDSRGNTSNDIVEKIENSILIGQENECIIRNIDKTIVVGNCSKAGGLKHSLLLGPDHQMNMLAHDNNSPFQIFAFGRGLQIPDYDNGLFAQQADYPIFLMGNKIFPRQISDPSGISSYAIVVGNEDRGENIFTLDYDGFINASGINVQTLWINGSWIDPEQLGATAQLTHRLEPLMPTNTSAFGSSRNLAYWYTGAGQDTLYINKYAGPNFLTSPTDSSWYSPKTIAFYTNEKNKPDEKATLQAKNFEADDTVSAKTVSASTLDATTVSATNLNGVLKTASFLSGLHSTTDGAYHKLEGSYKKHLYYCMIKVNNTTLEYKYYTCLFYLDTEGQTQHDQILHTWDLGGAATITLTWDSDDYLRLKSSKPKEYGCGFILIKQLVQIKGGTDDR